MTTKRSSVQRDTASDRDAVARELNSLAAAIARFRIETQRFLAGDLKLPPEELIATIREDLRRLQGLNSKAAAENFRISSLEAQFNSHIQLYGKRLRERERTAPVNKTSAPPSARSDRRRKGVVIGRSDDRQSIATLYQGMYPDRKPSSRDFAFERFGNRLMKQVAMIRQKTGCKEIAFRVAEQDGKLKLKARPLRPAGSKTTAKGLRSRS